MSLPYNFFFFGQELKSKHAIFILQWFSRLGQVLLSVYKTAESIFNARASVGTITMENGQPTKLTCSQSVNISAETQGSQSETLYYVKVIIQCCAWVWLYRKALSDDNNNYYTLNSISLFWLAESVQWIFEISACDVITADYTIIKSRTLKVMVIMSCLTAVHDF